MKKITLAIVLGLVALLAIGYSLTLIYAHQDIIPYKRSENDIDKYYYGCQMHKEHHEEMEEHHNQMMHQWMWYRYIEETYEYES